MFSDLEISQDITENDLNDAKELYYTDYLRTLSISVEKILSLSKY